MDRLKKAVLYFMLPGMLLAGIPGIIYAQQNVSAKIPDHHRTVFDELAQRFRKRGFDLARFVSREQFEIYEDIDTFYTRSPEKQGKLAYQEAAEKTDQHEAGELLNREYENYKKRVGFSSKKNGISTFLRRYAAKLTECEREYGIPKEIIAAVIGMESLFGRVSGKHYAFNVYVSMYIKGYRKDFAAEQLEELIKFSRKRESDIFSYRSSYAGAIGYMQFLPWSLNRWFVGNDVYDMEDAIASVGMYLSHFKTTRKTLERAVYSYNPNEFYVKTVIELAEISGDR